MYKTKNFKKGQSVINSLTENPALNEEIDQRNNLESIFILLCQQFIQNFESKNYQSLGNLVVEMANYACLTENPILNGFKQYNLAYYLMQSLEIDETESTITCISYCLAHEDEIAEYFLKNGFLFKANELINQGQFISPLLTALSNIASISHFQQMLVQMIPYDAIINIYSRFNDDQIILTKLTRLLMNLSKKPPVPPILFNCLIDILYQSPSPKASKNTLWGLHYSLSYTTELSKICIDRNLIQFIIQLIQNNQDVDFVYIEFTILVDIFKSYPDYFIDFNLNLVTPFFYSDDKMLVKVAMLLFTNIVKAKGSKLIEDDFIQLCKNIISDSSFKIKNDIYDLITTLIDSLTISDLISLLYQGIVEILVEIFDTDQIYLITKSIKSLSRLIYSSMLFKKDSDPDSKNELSPCQFLEQAIDIYQILPKIQNIVEMYGDNDSLMSEVEIFRSSYNGNLCGIHF